MIAVIDLDNCISDEGWRHHHAISNAEHHWDHYHRECYRDRPANLHIVKQLVTNGYEIVVFTARPTYYMDETVSWLNEHSINFKRLYMRPMHNFESSVAVKKLMLDQLRAEFGQDCVKVALDDRLDILEMYADSGVPVCWRVFIHPPEVRGDNVRQDS